MDLDKRIDSIDDIFTPFSSYILASAFVGRDGYFAQRFEDFHDLGICRHGTLDRVDENNNAFLYRIKESGVFYKYFLPSQCVQFPEESKFRPFNLHEFLVKFSIGTTITFRRKNNNCSLNCSFTLIFVGYAEKDTKDTLDICLGSTWYSFEELAEEYEYKGTTGEWVAFGVKEL